MIEKIGKVLKKINSTRKSMLKVMITASILKSALEIRKMNLNKAHWIWVTSLAKRGIKLSFPKWLCSWWFSMLIFFIKIFLSAIPWEVIYVYCWQMIAKIKPMIAIKSIGSVIFQIIKIFRLLIPCSTNLVINQGKSSS